MFGDVQPGRNLTKVSLEFANSSIIIKEWWVMDHKNGNGISVISEHVEDSRKIFKVRRGQ
jgi:hypothetical protein